MTDLLAQRDALAKALREALELLKETGEAYTVVDSGRAPLSVRISEFVTLIEGNNDLPLH